MATENIIDPDIMKKTQETLGKYIKKPQFTEKLLKKPPFRFLHDVINVIIKETGTLNGLYTKSELISDNIKDRDSKIGFLQKLIDVIKITTNEDVSARPSKIVAGHEPEKTNEMLQLLGKIIDQKLDCSKAIEKVNSVGGPTTTTTTTTTTPTTKSTSKTKAKETTEKKQLKSKIPGSLKRENTKESKDKIVVKVKDVDKKVMKKITKVESIESNSSSSKDKKNPVVSKAKIVDSNKINDSGKQLLKNNKGKTENHIGKQENKKNNQINNKKEQKIENDELKKSPIIEPKRKESDNSNSEKDNKVQNSNKNIEKLYEFVPNNDNNNETIVDVIPSSRKSSAPSHKSNIDKSSDSNNGKDTNRSDSVLQISNENNTKKMEKINSPLKNESISNNESKLVQPISSSVNNENTNAKPLELKRQSTFTREDSKENGSTVRPRTSLRPPSVRPASSRPGAPRRRDKNVEIILQPNDQVKLAGIQVKLESFNTELEDDGENLVIIENSNSTSDLIKNDEKILENIDIDENQQQGHLVQQILETQKELVQSNTEDLKYESDIDTIQKRQSSAKQMDSLRDLIQNLTRSINPLGKLMDFIPEDIDSMQLEMTMWRDNYTQSATELKKEKSLTESAIEPMKNQLSQINANIKEYTEMIDTSQAKILQNSEKIHYLLIDQ